MIVNPPQDHPPSLIRDNRIDWENTWALSGWTVRFVCVTPRRVPPTYLRVCLVDERRNSGTAFLQKHTDLYRITRKPISPGAIRPKVRYRSGSSPTSAALRTGSNIIDIVERRRRRRGSWCDSNGANRKKSRLRPSVRRLTGVAHSSDLVGQLWVYSNLQR